MKMKKITAFIVAILSILTIASYAPMAKVSAASDVEFVQGYNTYSVEYVIGKFVNSDVEADGYAYKVQGAAEYGEVIKAAHTFKGSVENVYEIEIYNGETAIEASAWKNSDHTFKLVKDTSKASLRYDVTNEKLAAYQDSILKIDGENQTGKLAGKELGDSFTYPDLTDLLVSDYFDYNALKSNLTLYYCKPTSSTFSSTTSKSFTLDQVGTYSYYVVAKDPTGTALTVDTNELERKVGDKGDGWYDESNQLIVPIFSFHFATVKAPEITISNKVEEGYIGLTYLDASEYITIVANNESVKYELYYSATDLTAQATEWTSEGVELLTQEGSLAVNVTENEDIDFSTSSLEFTPDKAGYYYVLVTVADKYGEASAVTYAIEVNSGFSQVKLDTDFGKILSENLLSVILFGVALLCLIGIIVLIFVKPKEEKEEVEVTVSKK